MQFFSKKGTTDKHEQDKKTNKVQQGSKVLLSRYIQVGKAGKVPSKLVPSIVVLPFSLTAHQQQALAVPGFAPIQSRGAQGAHGARGARGARIRSVNIGINYDGDLSGCHKDATDMYALLRACGARDADMKYLADDGRSIRPTRDNILASIAWLLTSSESGDTLVLTYSGHGSNRSDSTGTESDGMMETIIPYDYQRADVITDDTIWALVNQTLGPKPGVTLWCLFDACHSGTFMDLPNVYSPGKDKKQLVYSYESARRETKADVRCLSGCKDSQTSADVGGASPHGAFTACFLTMYKANKQSAMSYQTFIVGVEDLLQKGGFAQRAVFSSSRKLDLDSTTFRFPYF